MIVGSHVWTYLKKYIFLLWKSNEVIYLACTKNMFSFLMLHKIFPSSDTDQDSPLLHPFLEINRSFIVATSLEEKYYNDCRGNAHFFQNFQNRYFIPCSVGAFTALKCTAF